jgi:hypothetical protein
MSQLAPASGASASALLLEPLDATEPLLEPELITLDPLEATELLEPLDDCELAPLPEPSRVLPASWPLGPPS